jgi:uncharacterized RDD family membrane protein YckC
MRARVSVSAAARSFASSAAVCSYPPSPGRSLLRLVGLVLAIVPLFAGFIPVPFTERRRGLPDFLAGTAVVYDDPRAGTPLEHGAAEAQ